MSRRGRQPFPGTAAYWERRYASGGTSGAGSYGPFAEFKAKVINDFVSRHHVDSVIEFGCGDGNQLKLARYPRYLGLDVSESAVARCQSEFPHDRSKEFKLSSEYRGEKADLALSLDVIYHLVEEDVFQDYMRALFGASNRYVIIYSSNSDDNRRYDGTHLRQRKFTEWVAVNMPGWRLIAHIPNEYPYEPDTSGGSIADFFIYQSAGQST
ncbi:MAG: class I SAM-dependent methyltransferase [Nitrospiria bacterium]